MRLLQVVQLASDMDPARSFLNAVSFIKMVESGVSIGLQNAPKLLEVPSRMFAFAIRRVSKPHRRSRRVACWTVIPYIGPQTARFRLALARR